ncbi:hypothetical protein GQ457_08G033940 [Hibiscus cannabinus]
MACEEGEIKPNGRVLRYPRYRYPRSSTGTLGTDTLNPRTDTPCIFLKPEIPIAILSIDTQGEYRYPKGDTDTHCTRKVVTAGKCSQRSPTARYTIGTIKQASKHQEKTNASLYNINMIKNCLSAQFVNFCIDKH